MSNPRRRPREQNSDSDVEEVNILEDDIVIDSEGSGEDLEEFIEQDYREIPELDQYDVQELDEDEYSELDYDIRRRAEEELDERDMAMRIQRQRGPAALEEDYETNLDLALLTRHRAMQHQQVQGLLEEGEEDDLDDMAIDREDAKGKLKSWIKEVRCIRWIQKQFKRFLNEFKDEHEANLYVEKIHEMCANNQQSFEISYPHLQSHCPTIALWIADEPKEILPILNEIAFQIATHKYQAYTNIFQEIYVRIRDLPIRDQLRNLRYTNVNNLVRITGVVTRRTAVFPHLKVLVAACVKCGEKKGPIAHNGFEEPDLGLCGSCQSKGPYTTIIEETIYRNYQKITLQESPENVPAGRVPMHKDIILLGDLVDRARAGEVVDLTGIYCHGFETRLNIKHSFPVFATIIEANYIKPLRESELGMLTDEDKQEIRAMAQRPNIGKEIIDSIAPSIYGHEFVKTALALAMFGGQAKDVEGKHKIRGDINVLVLGDPGVAKSQFLKYVQQTFHRCVYTTGKGASAVGLTAGVRRDPLTREWVLEGGAMVLADNGVCLIDEFDKMNDHDRTSIHEAMEQQTISVSKAGIVATLQARCSVIAAANPVGGRYDSTKVFMENVDLTEPILSRFDILCVVKDIVDVTNDEQLATFVINSHVKCHPDGVVLFSGLEGMYQAEAPIDQKMLKKYILYARQYVHPTIQDIDLEKITKFYSELRQASQRYGGNPITVRHIESLVRIAEAHARMHLRDVTNEDVNTAIKIVFESYLQSQKKKVMDHLKQQFRKYLNYNDDPDQLLFHLLNTLLRERTRQSGVIRNIDLMQQAEDISIQIDELEIRAREHGITDINSFIRSPTFQRAFTLQNREIRKRRFQLN